MKKSFLISLAVMTVLFGTCSISYAADTQTQTASATKEVQAPDVNKPNANRPPECGFNQRGEFAKQQPPRFEHPSKAEMDAKKAEFEKRLNLTETQKKKIETQKAKDREKIKPIMDKMRANHEEMRKIKFDPTLSQKDKEKKITKLQKERNSLKQKADKCRKDNMKSFESILTSSQKAEFAKIKSEQKKEMAQRKKEFNQMRKLDNKIENPGKHPPFGILPPPPLD